MSKYKFPIVYTASQKLVMCYYTVKEVLLGGGVSVLSTRDACHMVTRPCMHSNWDIYVAIVAINIGPRRIFFHTSMLM